MKSRADPNDSKLFLKKNVDFNECFQILRWTKTIEPSQVSAKTELYNGGIMEIVEYWNFQKSRN